ncbi:MAG: hypothetical protein HGA45_34795 [Chloroflexales bacterium]|nr:hypothetical protein [Chloroflexales bacterium]
MRRLLIISCGATKRTDPGLLPAIQRYNGSPFKTLRATLRAMDGSKYPTILILSANFGLIHAERPIPDYNLRLTTARALTLRTQVRQALVDALTSDGYAGSFINLGHAYLAALPLEPEVIARLGEITYAQGGIGKRLAQMKAWLLGT